VGGIGTTCPRSVDEAHQAVLATAKELLANELVEGSRAPSSEMAPHLACYQAFDEVGSVIHSHPVHDRCSL